MTDYHMYRLNLTKNQTNKIIVAAKKHASVTIRLAENNLQGNHKLALTQTQITQIKKAST